MKLSLEVNGRTHAVTAEPGTPLLYVLRNDFGLNGPKFGCGLGQCGSCAVLLDGEVLLSCLTPVEDAVASKITTLEGLGSRERPHALQSAFIEEQALQCGYCTNGMIVAAAALLARHPDPSDEQIRQALATNLCRCGAHPRILRAVRRAAGREVR
jgi:nicotinate dehydrogenase subunit A